MTKSKLFDRLERSPVIAAVKEDNWDRAIASPSEVIFHLKANLLTVKSRIDEAKASDKLIFVHLDLADGIGKDRTGVEFLARCGVHGIISTRTQIVNYAKEKELLAVQRFFALDSQGLSSITDTANTSPADLFEIMPGVIGKVISKFSKSRIPVIAGGLIEEKSEVTAALQFGAIAVSTGKEELWYI